MYVPRSTISAVRKADKDRSPCYTTNSSMPRAYTLSMGLIAIPSVKTIVAVPRTHVSPTTSTSRRMKPSTYPTTAIAPMWVWRVAWHRNYFAMVLYQSFKCILLDLSRRAIPLSMLDSTEAPYIAIFHVWSDGLGKARANTLPQCQLRRLQDHIDDLYESSGPIPFWIDTICVPLERQARKTAIYRMGQTYAGSDNVLVIDSWLAQTGLDGPEAVDLLKIKSCM